MEKSSLQKTVDFKPISLKEFYTVSQVGWRDEFEKWLKQVIKPCHIDTLFPFDTWLTFYTDFTKQNSEVLWVPFRKSSADFNFIVCEFISDGFYNYFELGQQFNEEDWKFIRAYRNKQDARYFVEDHNKHIREFRKEQAEKNLVEKVAETLVPEAPNFDNPQSVLLSKVEDPTLLNWKEAMKALIDGKRVEARVCILGLPESENEWFDVEFAAYPDCAETGCKIELGQDWEYRIKDDSEEREELFDECEKLGIINVSKVSKIPTPLLHDIVDAIKSTDLDWEEIAKQVNEETK